jgi:type II secretory pathway pseudopilin PulG
MKKFNTKYKNFCKIKKGFTLLETLIVVGVTVAIAGVGISSYVGQQRVKLLESTAREIVGYLRYAQQKSISQEQGLQWGVRFENPASGSDFYALYTGTTYSSPLEIKYLPAGITFQTPAQGNSVNVSFEKLTGVSTISTTQSITIKSTVTNSTTTISISGQGVIFY